MNKKLRVVLLILLILGLQTVIGVVFIKPYIFTWGATDQEVSMSMPGDHLAPLISSTRSITINAPISDVWDWVIQLGADRGGFYSYWFIEKPLGYKYRETNRIEAEFKDMKVGRVIKASLDPSNSFIEYNFPVISVDPGKSMGKTIRHSVCTKHLSGLTALPKTIFDKQLAALGQLQNNLVSLNPAKSKGIGLNSY